MRNAVFQLSSEYWAWSEDFKIILDNPQNADWWKFYIKPKYFNVGITPYVLISNLFFSNLLTPNKTIKQLPWKGSLSVREYEKQKVKNNLRRGYNERIGIKTEDDI